MSPTECRSILGKNQAPSAITLTHRLFLSAMLAVTLVLAGGSARAGQEPSEYAKYRFSGFIGFGPSYPEEDFGLLGNATGKTALMLGFGHRIAGVLMGEIEFGVMGREHEVSTLTKNPTLELIWLSYSLLSRFNLGRFEPFIGIGAGQGQATLQVVGEPFEPPELDLAEDRGLVVNYRTGFDFALGRRHRLGLEVRKTDCEVDLGAFSGGEAQIGGVSALVFYRYTFGQRKQKGAGP